MSRYPYTEAYDYVRGHVTDYNERRIIKPWRGYIERTIQHPHFGPESVRVFAIYVGP